MDNFNKEIKAILIKKAKGFYYKEETIEFTEEVSNPKIIKRKRGRPPKNEKAVTLLLENEKLGVNCSCKKDGEDAGKQETSLVKRKITTHYVPPDMLAIKMLFENFGEKVDALDEMSDEEILNLKEQYFRDWEKENESK